MSTIDTRASLNSVMNSIARHPELFCCPRCGGGLRPEPAAVVCASCSHRFPVTDGIPQLFWPNEWDGGKEDVTELMKSFYEDTPFPNYAEMDSAGTLIEKARRRVFAKMLDDQIPFGARIIECGCGTGQLSNFLALANRRVFGVDLCLNSLRLANAFKAANAIDRVTFLQMNLFRPCFRKEQFDLVISNGVLHHTSDPQLAFQSIASLARPGGYVMVGLYHRYGRLATDLRRVLFRFTGGRMRSLDRDLAQKGSAGREKAWYMDQYRNPHESKHTVGEVTGWLRVAGLEFVRSIPRAAFFRPVEESEKLFAPDVPAGPVERALSEIAMMFSARQDGGLFIVIARKSQ